MSTKRPTRAKRPTKAEMLARWLSMGICGLQDQRDASAELLRLHALVAAYEAEKAKAAPVAARYDFDGYGYRYIDNGSGSDWQTRIPDAEMLYTKSDEAEIRADERERCARLCEFEASGYSSPKLNKLLTDHGRRIKEAQGVGAMNCANAIRSMGKEGDQA